MVDTVNSLRKQMPETNRYRSIPVYLPFGVPKTTQLVDMTDWIALPISLFLIYLLMRILVPKDQMWRWDEPYGNNPLLIGAVLWMTGIAANVCPWPVAVILLWAVGFGAVMFLLTRRLTYPIGGRHLTIALFAAAIAMASRVLAGYLS